ncbi:hypothetical protein ACFY78_20755 [Streptomyces olindensis]|uniref:hypothetical protein n=1 Tax=Streptomyces olindensis TaxID=358823 RepID=UPI0036C6A87B
MPLRLRLRLAGLCETVLLALLRLLLPSEGRHRATRPQLVHPYLPTTEAMEVSA